MELLSFLLYINSNIDKREMQVFHSRKLNPESYNLMTKADHTVKSVEICYTVISIVKLVAEATKAVASPTSKEGGEACVHNIYILRVFFVSVDIVVTHRNDN